MSPARMLRRRAPSLLFALTALVMGLAPGRTAALADDIPTCDGSSPTWTQPIRLGAGTGYEPGIEVDSAGTIFVTAHKTFPAGAGVYESSDDRMQSWLFRSIDGGKTFTSVNDDIGPLAGQSKHIYGDEGDLAVDAQDHLYFADTWAVDDMFYRFSNHGATLDLFRPVVPTYEVDDRPWLAAHGNGFVYYMSNTGYKQDGRLTVHRSTDGGQTFDPIGYTLPESGWGTLEADPNSSFVYAFTNDDFYPFPGGFLNGPTTRETIYISPDRGLTWTSVKVADVPSNNDGGVDYPQVTVSPLDGTVYTLWSDGPTLNLGISKDHGQTWSVEDVTPFAGSYDSATLTAGPRGEVGIGFRHGTNMYATIWRPTSDCLRVAGDPTSLCTGPSSVTSKVESESAPDQVDFFQVKFSPTDNALNIPYENTPGQLKFVRQAAGANMTGTPTCGYKRF
ncbi:MAG: hypothetical protein ABR600_01085 [Actinomycetota bacterium]